MEHANRFAKAVNLGNNGEFAWATYQEQLIAEAGPPVRLQTFNHERH